MKIRYYIVPFSWDGFSPTIFIPDDGFENESEAERAVQKLLDHRPNEKWIYSIIKAYSKP